MENRSTNPDGGDAAMRTGRHAALAFLIRRLVGYGMGGAVGGAVLALVQHLGPALLEHPALIRWVFLYALLGGILTGVWDAVTQWAAAWCSLSRRGTVVASGLVAGTLLGGAAFLVAALTQGAGTDASLLLRLPWTEGVGGFLGGAVGGGLWRSLFPHS